MQESWRMVEKRVKWSENKNRGWKLTSPGSWTAAVGGNCERFLNTADRAGRRVKDS